MGVVAQTDWNIVLVEKFVTSQQTEVPVRREIRNVIAVPRFTTNVSYPEPD